MRYQTVILCLIVSVAGACLCGCVDAQMREASGCTWGTTYHIKYRSASDLSDSIVQQMRRVDESLSPFETGSLVWRLNQGQTVAADSLLRDVIGLSQRVCRLSGGAFDPTVAPLVNLWGFGYREGEGERPSQAAIDSALCTVGILDCGIGDDGRVYKKSQQTEFNFSAVAKGYGVDLIAAMLRRNGCTDYMVEVGGELALSGDGPSGDGWVIQIDAPVEDAAGAHHTSLRTIRISDAGVATSGNYRNYRLMSQGTVGHTIDPASGYPVVTSTLSATVVAADAAMADALATSIMAMPLDKALQMLDGLEGVDALIVSAGADGEYEIFATPGMERLLR